LSRLASTVSALRYRDFRRLWAGTFCATAGQWVQQATLGWVVYDLTRSGTLLGAVLAMRAIPMLLLAPVSGVVAERFDRRRALAASQVVVVLISFALAVALAIEQIRVWHLFVFTLLAGTGMVFDRTLRNTLVFSTVPRADVANAVALNSIAFSVTRALGPAAAGFLIAWTGAAWNFVLLGLLYLGVAVAALMTGIPYEEARRTAHATAWAEMTEGLRFAVTDPIARMMMLLGILPSLLLIPSFSALMPVFAVNIFDAGPEGLGLLLSAVGVGGVLGGIAAVWTSRYDRVGLTQVLGLLGFVGSLIGFALSPNITMAAMFLAAAGMSEMIHMTANVTTLQMCAPPELRGRVASLLPMFPALIAVGSFTSGAGADLIGAPALVILLAAVASGIVGLAWTRSGVLRELRLSNLVAGRKKGDL
jgi:MFS family permease